MTFFKQIVLVALGERKLTPTSPLKASKEGSISCVDGELPEDEPSPTPTVILGKSYYSFHSSPQHGPMEPQMATSDASRTFTRNQQYMRMEQSASPSTMLHTPYAPHCPNPTLMAFPTLAINILRTPPREYPLPSWTLTPVAPPYFPPSYERVARPAHDPSAYLVSYEIVPLLQ